MRPVNPYSYTRKRSEPRPVKRGDFLEKDLGLPLARTKKAKKPVKRAKGPEAAIQESVEAYLKMRGLSFFHMPDALLRAGFAQGTAKNWALINAAADVRGLPDLLIFDPARHGLMMAIELKTEVGKMTSAQRAWQVILGTRLCRSFEAAKAEIDAWVADPVGYWAK